MSDDSGQDLYAAGRLFAVGERDRDTVLTPAWLFEALGLSFGLDPCSAIGGDNVPAAFNYTIEDDGLAHAWSGLVWCNPPFSEPAPWVRRMIEHRNGVLLTVASLGGWYRDLWYEADAIVVPARVWPELPWLVTLAAFGDEATAALPNLGPARVRPPREDAR